MALLMRESRFQDRDVTSDKEGLFIILKHSEMMILHVSDLIIEQIEL